jgi:homoserine dehydrogenase
MAGKPVYIGIIGFGKVGSGTYETLLANQASIDRKVGRPVRIRKIADINWSAPRSISVPVAKEMQTTDASDLIADPDISIIVESIGGIKPSLDLVLSALRAGKNVVTSNKELIARHGKELFDAAAERSLDLMFEGAVGGGIPILRPLKSCLAANRIQRVMGIVNGTTNFILSRMAQEGAEFGDSLAEAQRLGYAEPDPTNDIEGFDATFKLAILASIAFETRVPVESIHREGITRITARDIGYAHQLGFAVKLLAIGVDAGGALEARVHPTLLPLDHPLSKVSGPFNAIFVRGSSVGEVMFYGQGAGSLPTGSAMVGDIIDTARNIVSGSTGRIACTCFEGRQVLPMEEVTTRFYLRTQVADRPGVLAAMARVFADEQVSLASVLQMSGSGLPAEVPRSAVPTGTAVAGGDLAASAKAGESAEIVWLTHKTKERQMQATLRKIERLPEVHEISNCIRAETDA